MTPWAVYDPNGELRYIGLHERTPLWKATAAPSVSGGYWVIYGMAAWSSYCRWLIPGTFDPEKW